MDAALPQDLCIREDVLKFLLKTSNSSTLDEALRILIGISRNDEGRSDLSSKGVLPEVLQLVQYVSCPSAHHLLLLSLRLLRNLCAEEAANQNLFVEQNGVEVVSAVIHAAEFECDDSGCGIIRTALQVLANVSLAGEKHQCAIWDRFFPDAFLKVARIRRRETCDPLAMIVYACSDGRIERFVELCRNAGLAIMGEIVQTASNVGFGEDWVKLLLSRICLEESHFSALFTVLSQNGATENSGDFGSRDIHFASSQAFLLQIISEILNERLEEIHIGDDFAIYIFGICQRAVKAVDFLTRGQSALPTGSACIDVLGYSLCILRDVCAQANSGLDEGPKDVVNSLVSRGLLDLLLFLLRELGLPSFIRKTLEQNENLGQTSQSSIVCPYKGFRREIVAIIGNCSFKRKHVQDEIRQKNGIFLLLQQCVVDEDNPFLREWGIWCAKNLLEGNAENAKLVSELEMQGPGNTPELAEIGLRVEVNPDTRQARLVNIT